MIQAIMSSDRTDTPKGRILVVDDIQDNLILLSDLLGSEGHDIRTAVNGKMALSAAIADPPDLILLDIKLPDIDGYTVCKDLKSDAKTRSIPVIFISAYDAAIDKVKAFAVGGVDYISRPFHLEEALARIENQLRLQSAQALLRERNHLLEQEIRTRQQAETLFLQYSDMLENFSTNLKHLHRLNTTDYDTLDDLFADFLKTGCKILNLPTGIISQVQQQTYTIQAVESDLDFLAPNLTFNLADTYCATVIQSQKTVAETYAGQPLPFFSQSGQPNLKMEAYLGTPIRVDGNIYGVLSFFSTQVSSQSFGTQEEDIIELMAQSLGRSIALRAKTLQNQQVETELRSREIRLRHRNAVLATLARSKVLYRGNLSAALQKIAEAASQVLEIERVSIWRYDTTGSMLHCIEIFERDAGQHSTGAIELTAIDSPTYFNALAEDWTIAAHDVCQDPRTRDLAKRYLTPAGITSMLAIPIRLGGQTVGVVSFERIGVAYHWSLETQNFAGSIADLVSLALEAQERKQAEEALRASEEKFAIAFRSNPEPMAIVRLDNGRYLAVNDSFLEVFGFTRQQIIGRTPDELNSWVDRQDRTNISRLMQVAGMVRDREMEFRIADGTVKTLLFSAERIQLDGQACLLAVARDVTLRKQLETTLKDRQPESKQRPLVEESITIANPQQRPPHFQIERYDRVTILSANLVGIPTLADQMQPQALARLLSQIFACFHQLTQQQGLRTLQTFGDVCRVVSGLAFARSTQEDAQSDNRANAQTNTHTDTQTKQSAAIANLALAMQQAMPQFEYPDKQPLQLRIGIDSGPAIAGSIQHPETSDPTANYDLWGETADRANDLASRAEPGRIRVSATIYKQLKHRYTFDKRAARNRRGQNTTPRQGGQTSAAKTKTATYWLTGEIKTQTETT